MDELKLDSSKKRPRNVRNNNPGNIKDFGIPWEGKAKGNDPGGDVASGAFEIFQTPEYGVRALARDIKTKGKRGLKTIQDILPVYAPNGKENNTEAYIRSVESQTGIGRDTPLTYSDEQMLSLIRAMTRHEGGKESLDYFNDSIILSGIRMEKK